jgi:excisionase family DNA binding protein
VIDLFETKKQFLNVDEVCELFGVSRRTVYYWLEDRRVESITIGHTIRISVRDLRRQVETVRASLPFQTVARFVRVYPVDSHV